MLPKTGESRAGNNPELEAIYMLKVQLIPRHPFSVIPHVPTDTRTPSGAHLLENTARNLSTCQALATGVGGRGGCAGGRAHPAASRPPCLHLRSSTPEREKYKIKPTIFFFCWVRELKQLTERRRLSPFGSFYPFLYPRPRAGGCLTSGGWMPSQ